MKPAWDNFAIDIFLGYLREALLAEEVSCDGSLAPVILVGVAGILHAMGAPVSMSMCLVSHTDEHPQPPTTIHAPEMGLEWAGALYDMGGAATRDEIAQRAIDQVKREMVDIDDHPNSIELKTNWIEGMDAMSLSLLEEHERAKLEVHVLHALARLEREKIEGGTQGAHQGSAARRI